MDAAPGSRRNAGGLLALAAGSRRSLLDRDITKRFVARRLPCVDSPRAIPTRKARGATGDAAGSRR
jgi:hypothetical protein